MVALLLTSCAAPSPPPPAPPPPDPPAALASCPEGSSVPAPPRPPRTVEAIARWASDTAAAVLRADRARDECARRLRALNDWIKQGGVR